MEPTKELQETLFAEMRGRIKEDDSSVPSPDGPFAYGMLDEVAKIVRDDVVYVPLHIQPLLWGSKSNIDLTQRADNFLMLRWINVN